MHYNMDLNATFLAQRLKFRKNLYEKMLQIPQKFLIQFYMDL